MNDNLKLGMFWIDCSREVWIQSLVERGVQIGKILWCSAIERDVAQRIGHRIGVERYANEVVVLQVVEGYGISPPV